jgi:hypothetical protein
MTSAGSIGRSEPSQATGALFDSFTGSVELNPPSADRNVRLYSAA